jgi:hypothetical protein
MVWMVCVLGLLATGSSETGYKTIFKYVGHDDADNNNNNNNNNNNTNPTSVFATTQVHIGDATLETDKKWHALQGQDAFLVEKIFPNKTDGFYVDCASNDATIYSNTYSLERDFGW